MDQRVGFFVGMVALGVGLFWLALLELENVKRAERFGVDGDPFVVSTAGIIAHVSWGSEARSSISKDAFTRHLERAFQGQNARVKVIVKDEVGSRKIPVSYEVGPNVIGPFDAAYADRGIRASVDALRMNGAN